jgi:hypothetical protein
MVVHHGDAMQADSLAPRHDRIRAGQDAAAFPAAAPILYAWSRTVHTASQELRNRSRAAAKLATQQHERAARAAGHFALAQEKLARLVALYTPPGCDLHDHSLGSPPAW